MTRREMMARMGADELEEWRAFYRISPFGDERADLRMARICQAVASSVNWKTTLGDWALFRQVRQPLQSMLVAAKSLGSWFRGNHNRQS